ncbi:MAG TPA: phosphoadenylyl-sulfate reductase [Cyclobacteriaceae bacterium]|jgi:phosphoadenosine phosphosulfate reductase|nr:phosphoadenylyl-sulfate reductase [Cyclobacteriaceae bacterium]HRF32778.1 phosphoadenylyl-sulfate reductase [Cyclobacteriaceae bacterium]
MDVLRAINHLNNLNATEGLAWASSNFKQVRFATSLGEEDQAITHLIAKNNLPVQIFTLDTGRLFQETYDLLHLTRLHYNTPIQVYFPDTAQVEEYVQQHGINGFYDSVENRKQCCHIRKVVPLKRALTGAEIWVTGLRQAQSANRGNMQRAVWDEEYKLIKYNPVFDWSDDQLHEFIEANKIPVNTLHKKGFPSIGCAPCTRAVMPGEDARAGRWWWESSAKECGLHATVIKQNT